MCSCAMPRTARHNRPQSILHVISRFVDRDWFFETDDERALYLRLLGHGLRHSDWRCLAYAIMSNHVHLQFVVGRKPMESWTRRVNSPFGRWMNKRRERLGPVFAHRAKDYEFPPESSGQVTAYIHNNPVRAGVVKRARDSNWTSHRAYAGLDPAPAWLHVEDGLRLAGFSDRDAFDRWVDITPGKRADPVLDAHRRAVRRRGALELGTPLVAPTGVEFPLVKRVFGHIRPDPRRLVKVATDVLGIEISLMCSRRRRQDLVEARAVTVLSGRALGLTPSELSTALGISVQGVLGLARRELGPTARHAFELITERLRQETWGAVTVAT